MYAERPRGPAADIARAKGAPNPFLPAIATRQASSTPNAKKTPPPMPELPNLRFLGTIAGDKGAMAVLADEGQRYYLRRGESLPGGWSVVQVGTRTITLKKGGQKVALVLDQQAEKQ
jgi:Type II secretion system protein C